MSTLNKRIKIMILEDHPLAQEGLKKAIDAENDLEWVDVMSETSLAYDLIKQVKPDVLILDLILRDGSGWNLLQNLKSEELLPNTLVLSICEEEIYARRLLKSGAKGYLMKDRPLDEVIAAIRSIHKGYFVLSQSMTSSIIQDSLDLDVEILKREGHELRTLSDRELQVLELLGQQKRNQEIAHILGISAKTVATFKARILEKLNLSNSYELNLYSQTLAHRSSVESNPLQSPSF